MSDSFGPVTLVGDLLTLEPLRRDHHDELVAAASDGELWNLWYTAVPRPGEMAAAIEDRLARQEAGTLIAFAARRHDTGRLFGMTNFWAVDRATPRVEIGGTWYARSAQRTGLNAECKLLLMSHAFDVQHCLAVEFRTHWMNHASRGAIARLGAKQDGVLRSHQLTADGSRRDTVVFSVLDVEWPVVRAELLRRLSARAVT